MLDKMTKKKLYRDRMPAMKSNVERIYLPYQGGGRGLISPEKEYMATNVEIDKYITHKGNIQIKAVHRDQIYKVFHSLL